jgi:hypothetical protein
MYYLVQQRQSREEAKDICRSDVPLAAAAAVVAAAVVVLKPSLDPTHT